MAGVNKVILIGRLGQDPESRYSQAGKAITRLRLATDSGFGEKRQTDWHTVVTFDKTAENCSKYLSKGRMVYVEGRISYRKWQKDDGTTQYFTEIIANDVQFLESRGGGTGPDEGYAQGGGGGSAPSAPDDAFPDTEIPF